MTAENSAVRMAAKKAKQRVAWKAGRWVGTTVWQSVVSKVDLMVASSATQRAGTTAAHWVVATAAWRAMQRVVKMAGMSADTKVL